MSAGLAAPPPGYVQRPPAFNKAGGAAGLATAFKGHGLGTACTRACRAPEPDPAPHSINRQTAGTWWWGVLVWVIPASWRGVLAAAVIDPGPTGSGGPTT